MPNVVPEPRLVYTPREAARLLCVSRTRVFQLIAAGELDSFRHGQKRLIRREALADYVDRIEQAATSRTGT